MDWNEGVRNGLCGERDEREGLDGNGVRHRRAKERMRRDVGADGVVGLERWVCLVRI